MKPKVKKLYGLSGWMCEDDHFTGFGDTIESAYRHYKEQRDRAAVTWCEGYRYKQVFG